MEQAARLRFGLDIDGVMYDWHSAACHLLNTERGYNLNWRDWDKWNWAQEKVTKDDWNWLWNTGVKMGLFRYGHLHKGTIEAVRSLSTRGDVVVITHRPRSAVQDTLDWLAYIRLPFTEIHLLTSGERKSTVKCDLYVDDKPKNIEDFATNTFGLPLLWLRPWNTAGPDVPGHIVGSWSEVIVHAENLYSKRFR